ncbi:type IX secretion system membrane protein PorP/SprF [Gilvibacter sediminis]|uniref:PorP/SprF family type IX secretion system membrane protein n=1 Tax=Gilvibacter sediminis TaxID=379071 RepID=UPI002350EFA4|nr:type IX secretion system membrane protein PorP/SprF [Gilvibacter sediminis]MDC7998779.1 type IX secretion system membrane protein PorP/SprF [Gilvibacter sediminis]
MIKKLSFSLVAIFLVCISFESFAQQDPQYTQYMYNTQVVNPAYVGSRGSLDFAALYRTQWVGLDGAPETGTFTFNSPIGVAETMGLGMSIVVDRLGPARESNVTVDYSYTINTSDEYKLAFGLKAGIDLLDVDFTLLNIFDEGDVFENNIDNRLQPQIGAGVYYYSDKFYAGLSVPNFLNTKHFDESEIGPTSAQTIAAERLHYFFITGYVFDVSESLKFKPAVLTKLVSGSPLQVDLSANFLINDKFTLGAAYRWSAALSGMVGFQATDGLFLGFAYDGETTDLSGFNDGSYEFFVRFEIFNKPERVLTPRFF